MCPGACRRGDLEDDFEEWQAEGDRLQGAHAEGAEAAGHAGRPDAGRGADRAYVVKSRPLYQLLDDLDKEIYLPHIQRPFVWGEDQVRKLLDSLLRKYPIQTLLFWRTKEEIKARRFMTDVEADVELHSLYDPHASSLGVERLFVLDGQQRLQALRTLFDGAIVSESGQRREAWLDLTSGHEQDPDGYWYGIKFAKDAPGPTWYRLANLRAIDNKKGAGPLTRQESRRIEGSLTGMEKEREAALDRVADNIKDLLRILKEESVFWYDELDGVVEDYPYERVLEVFVRVNNGGTRLDGGDLMFAAMKGLSEDIEERVEDMAGNLSVGDITFDKGWILKAVVVALTGKATLAPQLFSGPEGSDLIARIDADWPRIDTTFQQLHDLMLQDVRVTTERLIRSTVSLIPVVDYLYHHPGPNPEQRQLIVGYFHKAQLFNWFGASTDQLLAGLHPKMVGANSGFPIADVKAFFQNYRRETELAQANIAGSRIRSMILNLVYREKFDTTLFNSHFSGNEPHIDHIYPRARLKPLGLASEEINHLGNFRFVGAKDNIRKKAEPPDSHFVRMKAAGVPVERHLLAEPWASDPVKLKLDVSSYRSFRDARLTEILKIARRIVDPEVPS
jgi:Protein of unknown function DUF262